MYDFFYIHGQNCHNILFSSLARDKWMHKFLNETILTIFDHLVGTFAGQDGRTTAVEAKRKWTPEVMA